jgi:uroporphyrinogen-III synthase
MSDRRVTILSTSILPFNRIAPIPESVDLQIIPFIEIRPVADRMVCNKIEFLSTKKIIAVFTSAEAVKNVLHLLKDKKPDWKIYCIRNETRLAAEKLIRHTPDIKFADHALDLSNKIIADGIKELIFFCGDQRLNTLPENLKNNHISVTELIVYETRQVPVSISYQPDIIFFFSPSAIRSFFSMNELSAETKVFLIGTTTAETFKEYSANPFMISPEPDKAVVFNMALEYIRTLSLHE